LGGALPGIVLYLGYSRKKRGSKAPVNLPAAADLG